jgi:hypothetical protein
MGNTYVRETIGNYGISPGGVVFQKDLKHIFAVVNRVKQDAALCSGIDAEQSLALLYGS